LPRIRQTLRIRWFATESRRGFTLIELVLVVVIMGLLAALALPNFQAMVEKGRVTKAIADISVIGQNITEFHIVNGRYPESLEELGMGEYEDSWGNPYVYLVIEGARRGQLRKDKFLVPINSDYDLYSMGPDGDTTAPLGSAKGKDDIIRANDGGFVGVAENF
jgi:general secretion pathway protein G